MLYTYIIYICAWSLYFCRKIAMEIWFRFFRSQMLLHVPVHIWNINNIDVQYSKTAGMKHFTIINIWINVCKPYVLILHKYWYPIYTDIFALSPLIFSKWISMSFFAEYAVAAHHITKTVIKHYFEYCFVSLKHAYMCVISVLYITLFTYSCIWPNAELWIFCACMEKEYKYVSYM